MKPLHIIFLSIMASSALSLRARVCSGALRSFSNPACEAGTVSHEAWSYSALSSRSRTFTLWHCSHRSRRRPSFFGSSSGLRASRAIQLFHSCGKSRRCMMSHRIWWYSSNMDSGIHLSEYPSNPSTPNPFAGLMYLMASLSCSREHMRSAIGWRFGASTGNSCSHTSISLTVSTCTTRLALMRVATLCTSCLTAGPRTMSPSLSSSSAYMLMSLEG